VEHRGEGRAIQNRAAREGCRGGAAMREKEPERKLAQAVKAIGGGRALVSNPFRGKRVAQPKAKVNGFKKKAFQSPFGGSGLRN
jgi:hypothetical protein